MDEYIKKLLREGLLNEGTYAYHGGNLDHEELKAYYSDQAYRMDDGRDTGHFGSGTYFSTYDFTTDKVKTNDKYGNDFMDDKPELIKVRGFEDKPGGLYRVDLDLYKNLYRVKSEKHGTFLFRTLKMINGLYFMFTSEDEKKPSEAIQYHYDKISHNLSYISLNLPPISELILIAKSIHNEMASNGGVNGYSKDKNTPSLSTKVMEYNGYNGVNVSGVEMYDNGLHGSVIYDLNKVSSDIEQVDTRKFDSMVNIDKDVVGIGAIDIKTSLYRGDEISFSSDSFSDLNDSDKKYIIKHYFHYIPDYDLRRLDGELVDYYYQLLPNKIKSGKIKDRPSEEMIDYLINSNRYDVICSKDAIVKSFHYNCSLLEYVLMEYGDITLDILNNILSRVGVDELTEEGKRAVIEIKEMFS